MVKSISYCVFCYVIWIVIAWWRIGDEIGIRLLRWLVVAYRKYVKRKKKKSVAKKLVIYYVLQEICLLHGICKQKDVVRTVVIGPPLIEATSTMAIGKEAGIIIIMGITTLAITTGRHMVAILIFTALIMLTMLNMMPSHHLWKGENIQLLLGKATWDTIFHPLSKTACLHPVAFKNLLEYRMLIPLYHLAASLIALYLKTRSLSLCQGMRLIDSLPQEKMVLMYFMRHTCGTHIVPSFRILECGLSCKIHIRLAWLFIYFLFLKNEHCCLYAYDIGICAFNSLLDSMLYWCKIWNLSLQASNHHWDSHGSVPPFFCSTITCLPWQICEFLIVL